MEKKWTKEEMHTHVQANCENGYSMAVIVAALYKKIYGEFPKIGLSGHQASAADLIIDVMPNMERATEFDMEDE